MLEGKDLFFDNEARAKLLNGVTKLSKAVSSTLGPRGRNVIIRNDFSEPYLTKDGVTVARQIRLLDAVEDAGVRLVVQAAEKTVEKAGDGTTTATILTHAIFSEGNKHLTAGTDGMAIKRGLDVGVKLILQAIDGYAKPIETNADIKAVALISANGDEHIASLIASGVEQVGEDGVIVVQESKTAETFLEVSKGLGIDEGYISPYFVNIEGSKKCVLEDVYVVMTDRKMTSAKDVVPLMQFANKERKALLILAEHVEGEALATLILNTRQGRLRGCAVRAPGYGGIMKDTLDDIVALVGGKVVSENAAMNVSDVTESNYKEYFGTATKIEITDKGTTILNDSAKQAVEARVAFLKGLLQSETDEDRKYLYRKRIAKLAGGIAVIKAGALTQAELREKIDRIEDAVHATRAAKEEGIIPGAGSVLKHIKSELINSLSECEVLKELSAEEMCGVKILVTSLDAPLRILARNSGFEESTAMFSTKYESGMWKGINFKTLKECNLLEDAIIDPVLVAKCSLSNAVSIAGMLLTSNCIVSERRKERIQSQQEMIPQNILSNM